MRTLLCAVLLGILVAITVCENQENSENNDYYEPKENERKRTSREADESSGACIGKQQNELCDGGEGQCVSLGRSMVCVDFENGNRMIRALTEY